MSSLWLCVYMYVYYVEYSLCNPLEDTIHNNDSLLLFNYHDKQSEISEIYAVCTLHSDNRIPE